MFARPTLAGLWIALAAASCTKRTEVDASRTNTTAVSEVVRRVGPGGARVELAGRARVDIPPGALESEVDIRLADVTQGAHPALPAGTARDTGIYAFEPHGRGFRKEVVVTLFFGDPPAAGAALWTAPAEGSWSAVTTADVGETLAQAGVDHFSYFAVVHAAAGGAGGQAGAAGAGGAPGGGGVSGNGGASGGGGGGAASGGTAGASGTAGLAGASGSGGAGGAAGGGGAAGAGGAAGQSGAAGTTGAAGAGGAAGQSGCGEVDVVMTVDSSASMQEESAAIEAGLPHLFSRLSSQGLSVRFVLFSTTPSSTGGLCAPAPIGTGACPADEKLPDYRHVVGTVSEQYALQRLINDYSLYSATLRDTARTHVIVVSDESSIMTAQQFTDQFAPLSTARAGFVFHGVFATTTCTGPISSGDAAPTYVDLAAQTGGQVVDLCGGGLFDWGVSIGAAIAARSAVEPCH